MQRWPPAARGRRRTVFALALLAHGVGVLAMLSARVRVDRPGDGALAVTLWPAPPPPAPAPLLPLPLPQALVASRLRSVPHAAVEPHPIVAPLLQPQAIAQAASAPEPVASAASAPLRLTLSHDELRALIASSKPSLAQSLAQGRAPSALERLGGVEAPYEEVPLAGGVTEVHVHGGCFRLVPTARAQYDPFNHANERLTAACH